MKTSRKTDKLRMGWGLLVVFAAILGPAAKPTAADDPVAPEGWTTASPREEIRPEFRFEAEGPDGQG